MAVFGCSFKGADALMAVAEDENMGVGAGLKEATRARNEAKTKSEADNSTGATRKSFFKRNVFGGRADSTVLFTEKAAAKKVQAAVRGHQGRRAIEQKRMEEAMNADNGNDSDSSVNA